MVSPKSLLFAGADEKSFADVKCEEDEGSACHAETYHCRPHLLQLIKLIIKLINQLNSLNSLKEDEGDAFHTETYHCGPHLLEIIG